MVPRELCLQDVDALVFDVIGTLVDEDATFAAASVVMAETAGLLDPDGLRRSWSRLLDGKIRDVVEGVAAWRLHSVLVAEAGDEAVLEHAGMLERSLPERLTAVDEMYVAWPDVAEALRTLRARHLVAGFSNGDLGSLARLAHNNDLAWHVVLSTASIGTFKPASAAYQYVIETLSVDPSRTLFVAAHPWDLRAAREAGFLTAYVARPGAELPAPGDSFDAYITDLLQLVQMIAPVA